MYEIKYEQDKKVLHIIVSGFFKEEDGLGFLNNYNENLSKINAKDVTLIIESQDLKTSSPDMLSIMKNCYQLYNSSGFKNMIIVLPESPTAEIQAKRIAQNAGYIGKFAKTLSEAYSLANT